MIVSNPQHGSCSECLKATGTGHHVTCRYWTPSGLPEGIAADHVPQLRIGSLVDGLEFQTARCAACGGPLLRLRGHTRLWIHTAD